MSKWIQNVVPESHRGLATKAANREGEGVQEWAREHAHSGNPTTRGRAQFALRAKGGFKKHTLMGAMKSAK